MGVTQSQLVRPSNFLDTSDANGKTFPSIVCTAKERQDLFLRDGYLFPERLLREKNPVTDRYELVSEKKWRARQNPVIDLLFTEGNQFVMDGTFYSASQMNRKVTMKSSDRPGYTRECTYINDEWGERCVLKPIEETGTQEQVASKEEKREHDPPFQYKKEVKYFTEFVINGCPPPDECSSLEFFDVSISSPGKGYTKPPKVSLEYAEADRKGITTPAKLEAIVQAGKLEKIQITQKGSPFTRLPAVRIEGTSKQSAKANVVARSICKPHPQGIRHKLSGLKPEKWNMGADPFAFWLVVSNQKTEAETAHFNLDYTLVGNPVWWGRFAKLPPITVSPTYMTATYTGDSDPSNIETKVRLPQEPRDFLVDSLKEKSTLGYTYKWITQQDDVPMHHWELNGKGTVSFDRDAYFKGIEAFKKNKTQGMKDLQKSLLATAGIELDSTSKRAGMQTATTVAYMHYDMLRKAFSKGRVHIAGAAAQGVTATLLLNGFELLSWRQDWRQNFFESHALCKHLKAGYENELSLTVSWDPSKVKGLPKIAFVIIREKATDADKELHNSRTNAAKVEDVLYTSRSLLKENQKAHYQYTLGHQYERSLTGGDVIHYLTLKIPPKTVAMYKVMLPRILVRKTQKIWGRREVLITKVGPSPNSVLLNSNEIPSPGGELATECCTIS